MIWFFTGKPRNGKSLHMAEIIYHEMKKGKNVIANFEINEEYFKRCNKNKLGQFIYVPDKQWLNNAYKGTTSMYKKTGKYDYNTGGHYSYLDGLKNYALQFHKRNKRGQMIENQTLLIFDECQNLWNNRTWNRADRLDWCDFLRQHGKYGFEVYLISQDDQVVDKQIRHILEYEVEHRCINNYKVFGKIIGILLHRKVFIAIKRWYARKGKKDAHISSELFTAKKFYGFYDSYKIFNEET